MAYCYLPEQKVHNELFPANFRMLIVGSSGCGKTYLLMKLLLDDNLLNYDKLYMFARSLYHSEYQILQEGFKNKLTKKNMLGILRAGEEIEADYSDGEDQPTIEKTAKALASKQKKPSNLEAEFYSTSEDIPDPSELDMSNKKFNGI